MSKFAHIAEMTENNDHTGACIAGCELLLEDNPGLDCLHAKLKNVWYERERLGYLTSELASRRHELYEELMADRARYP